MKTIGRQFIETLLIGSIIMTLLCVALFMKGRSANLHERMAREYAEMAQSTSAYYSFLVSMVLRNDIVELDRYSNQVRKEENLEKAKVFTDRRDIDHYWMRCQFGESGVSPAVGIPSCYASSDNTLTTIQKLRSGSRTVGIILKTKKIVGQTILSSIAEQPDIFIWVLFVVIFGLHYKWRLHSTVVKPLKRMSEKAKCHERDSEKYKLEEMACLSNALEESQRVLIERSGMAAIGQMSSQVAHDMRSPLTVMKAYVGMGKSDTNEDAEYKAAAQRSVKKLLHMADDLVDYAKASKIERDAISLKKCIHDSISETSSSASSKGVAVESDIDKDATVNIDSYRFGRALVNLVNNAVQAIPHDHGRVSIKARIDDSKELIVEVEDNGKGIDSDSLTHIFDTFFTRGKKKGTGLGLSYCKQVIEAHGGTIGVESEVGRGTTFTIRIPNCVVSESEVRACKNDPQLKIDGRRFILIDNDADIRMRWRRIVEQGGGQVVGEADSPERATSDGLDCAAADVAIVDYSFDGSDRTGVDVISYLKRKGMKEVHMCTGYADDDDVRKAAFEAGADSVIQKDLG